MKNFTVEETNLMCCFNTSSRKRLIDDMKSVTLNDMDGEIAELMYKTFCISSSVVGSFTHSPTSIPSLYLPRSVSYTHLDVYKRQVLQGPRSVKAHRWCCSVQSGFFNPASHETPARSGRAD